MKKLRVLALVSLPTVFASAAVIVACSSDDMVITGDAGYDASNDTGLPGLPGLPETGTDADLDAGPRPDVVTPQTVAEFAVEVEKELCGALTRCCFDKPGIPDGTPVDGGFYDRAACAQLYRDIGFEFSSTGYKAVDGGEAVVDKAKATDCLGQVQLLSCDLTGTEMAKARATCFEAIVGTRTAGQPCEAAIECAPGHYCEADGGTCQALKGDGGNCSIYNSGNPLVDSVRSEEACSWRGSGDTKLRCDSYDQTKAGTADEYRPRDQWLCKPQVDLAVGCNSTVWCKDSICDIDNGYVCASPVKIFTTYCGRVIKDGG